MIPPLTPPDCDLRDFRFMPLDVARLAQSDMIATSTSGAIVADLLLWCAAWHQVPAGSLPNDDRVLSNLGGFGRVVSAWMEVREEVLSRWELCADGRLYHPVVAEKAREAWKAKLEQRCRSFNAAVRKHNERNPDDKRESLSYEQWEAAGRPREVANVAPKQEPRQPKLALDETPESSDEQKSRATDRNVTRDTPPLSDATPPRKVRDSASKGQGQGQGQGDSIDKQQAEDARDDSAASADLPLSRDDLIDLTNRICRTGAVHLSPLKPQRFTAQLDQVKAWLVDGIDVDKTILPTIANRLARTDQDTIGSLAFYDAAIRKAHAGTPKAQEAAKADSAWTPERRAAYLASLGE